MNTPTGYKPNPPKPPALGASDLFPESFGRMGETITMWDKAGRAVNGTITAFSTYDPCWGGPDAGHNKYMVVKVPLSPSNHPKDRPEFKRLAGLAAKWAVTANMPGYFEEHGTIEDYLAVFLHSRGHGVKSVTDPDTSPCEYYHHGCAECSPAKYAKFKDEHGITRFAPLEWLADAVEESLERWAANNIVEKLSEHI